MFNSISRGVFASSTRFTRVARFLHQVPKLESHETWTQEGIPGFLSPKGYNLAWTDYQNYLLTNLTLLTNGTSLEYKTPYKHCCTQPSKLHNNMFSIMHRWLTIIISFSNN